MSRPPPRRGGGGRGPSDDAPKRGRSEGGGRAEGGDRKAGGGRPEGGGGRAKGGPAAGAARPERARNFGEGVGRAAERKSRSGERPGRNDGGEGRGSERPGRAEGLEGRGGERPGRPPGGGRPDDRGPRPMGEPRRAREVSGSDRPKGGGAEPLPPVRGDRLEGRNVVEEALVRKRRKVLHIWLDAAARLDEKLSTVLELAAAAHVPVETIERARLDRMSVTGVHNGIIAEAEGLPQPSVKEAIAAAGFDGFYVLVDEVQYEHNLGAVLRSALGAGVSAVIIPTERGKGLTPIVQRVAMGGAEAVPVIREGLSSALAQLQRAGVRILAADMDGVAPWDLDMTGPVALVLGGEDKGVSDALKKRADAIVGIPLAGGLQSLNVSVSAAVLMFERVRQLAQRGEP